MMLYNLRDRNKHGGWMGSGRDVGGGLGGGGGRGAGRGV